MGIHFLKLFWCVEFPLHPERRCAVLWQYVLDLCWLWPRGCGCGGWGTRLYHCIKWSDTKWSQLRQRGCSHLVSSDPITSGKLCTGVNTTIMHWGCIWDPICSPHAISSVYTRVSRATPRDRPVWKFLLDLNINMHLKAPRVIRSHNGATKLCYEIIVFVYNICWINKEAQIVFEENSWISCRQHSTKFIQVLQTQQVTKCIVF